MTFTKRDFKLLIPYGIFVAIGIYGLYSVDFIQENQTMDKTFKWCGIPTLILAMYYGYRSSFSYDNRNPLWKNIVVFIFMTFLTSMILITSFQGLLVLINYKIGNQKEYLLTGVVTKLYYPKNKKLLSKYAIEIKRNYEHDIIKLNVPTNEYSEGQAFTKQMKIGSLGFIYAYK